MLAMAPTKREHEDVGQFFSESSKLLRRRSCVGIILMSNNVHLMFLHRSNHIEHPPLLYSRPGRVDASYSHWDLTLNQQVLVQRNLHEQRRVVEPLVRVRVLLDHDALASTSRGPVEIAFSSVTSASAVCTKYSSMVPISHYWRCASLDVRLQLQQHLKRVRGYGPMTVPEGQKYVTGSNRTWLQDSLRCCHAASQRHESRVRMRLAVLWHSNHAQELAHLTQQHASAVEVGSRVLLIQKLVPRPNRHLRSVSKRLRPSHPPSRSLVGNPRARSTR
jgi:hypothetical protein